MKLKVTFFLFVTTFLTMNLHGQPGPDSFLDSLYLPAGSNVSFGNGVFTGPISNTARTYQLLINESELTAVLNKEINGISMRIPAASTANWPVTEVLFPNYDIYLSGSVPPVNRSLVFAENIVGPQKQVRSGSLTISPGEYTFGNTPNYCGRVIDFDSSYFYTGGHLLIEIRQNGSNGTSRSNDAFTTSAPGYANLFSAAWVGSYTGTTGLAGNFSVIRLSYSDPVPVELISFSAAAEQNNIVLNWITATETNNSGFQVERLSGEKWEALGYIKGNGTTTERCSYGFTDKNLTTGKYIYRLKQIDYNGVYTYSDEIQTEVSSPFTFSLNQNYPNPFNPSTTINYSVKETSPVKIILFNSIGEEIAVILNEVKDAGYYTVSFNAENLAGGVYFYEMRGNNFSDVKKMILLK
jgi:hypothetical protein